MNPLDLTGLSPIMAETTGSAEIVIGLIDGPVALDHPQLTHENLRFIAGRTGCCRETESNACRHGTYIAGILNARRTSAAPAICPGCTLLVRPVFSELARDSAELPCATPAELAWAILDCIEEGASILNLSIALEEPSPEGDRKLVEALDLAVQKEVLIIAAAGNNGGTCGSVLTRHPWVVPVAACDLSGRPASYSNNTGMIRRNGLRAPGEKVTSLGSDGPDVRFCGTSTAVPFVSGAAALVWSASPGSTAEEIRAALSPSLKRRGVRIPPLLNAWEAHQVIQAKKSGYALAMPGGKAA